MNRNFDIAYTTYNNGDITLFMVEFLEKETSLSQYNGRKKYNVTTYLEGVNEHIDAKRKIDVKLKAIRHSAETRILSESDFLFDDKLLRNFEIFLKLIDMKDFEISKGYVGGRGQYPDSVLEAKSLTYIPVDLEFDLDRLKEVIKEVREIV